MLGAPMSGGSVESKTPRVVIVDDDAAVLRGLRRSLLAARPGWRVELVSSGAEALAALDREIAEVVVTDLSMPEMSGAELLVILAERYPGVGRVVHSAYTAKLGELGVMEGVEVLAKPAAVADLVAAIDRARGALSRAQR